MINFEFKYFDAQHLYLGCYWESYKTYDSQIIIGENRWPTREEYDRTIKERVRYDIWLGIPFFALRIIYVR